MTLPIRLGVGLLGVTAATGTSIWVWTNSEPNNSTIATYKDNSAYNSKFVEEFKHHFVDARDDNNIQWWDWSFKNRWEQDSKEDIDNDFKTGITSGSTLKAKCEEAYKKEAKSEVYAESKTSYEKSIWRYCSLSGIKPVTLSEITEESAKETGSKSSDSDKIGKTNEKKLISTVDPRNYKFWSIQEKAFSQNPSTEEDEEFKKLFEGKTNSTLRKTCAEAYKKSGSTSEKSKQAALKYCSLRPKEN